MNTSIGKWLLGIVLLLSLQAVGAESVVVQQGFEEPVAGTRPPGFQIYRFGREVRDRFEICSETSATGNQSLYFRRGSDALGWQAWLKFKRSLIVGDRMTFAFSYLLRGKKSTSVHRVILRRRGAAELVTIYLHSRALSVVVKSGKKVNKLSFQEMKLTPNRWIRIELSFPLTKEGGTDLHACVTDLAGKRSKSLSSPWTSFEPADNYTILWDFFKDMRQTELFLDDICLTVSTPDPTVKPSGETRVGPPQSF